MFVALNLPNRTRVVSISSEWDERIEALRKLASDGALVCQGCGQLLWLRTGSHRRRHFAHRSLKDCPLQRKSEEVLEAQSQVYRWLEARCPGRVDLDLVLEENDPTLTADLCVKLDSGKRLLLWIFDCQQRRRENFLKWKIAPGFITLFLHTMSAMKLHSEDQIALTSSQRDFLSKSDYDHCLDFSMGGHLHYLDSKTGNMLIFRGLWCSHEPNLFEWNTRREFHLDEGSLDEETGEIASMEDIAALKAWKKQQTSRPQYPFANFPTPAKEDFEPEPHDAREERSPISFNGPFRCEDCGEMTSDWSQATPGSGTCVCNRCIEIRYQK